MKNMKKIIQMLLIIMLALSTTGCFMSPEQEREKAKKILLEHLEKKYGEPFYISSNFGQRGEKGDKLRVRVQQLKYKGTEKQWDSYYEDTAGIDRNWKPSDGAGKIYLNQSANNFFKPKLEELFGKNIIVALDVTQGYKYIDFEEEMAYRARKRKKTNEKYGLAPIEGDIHIFGRIDSIEDREKYRKKIYEFIQYIKEKGYFEYLYIAVRIYDERALTPSYYYETDRILDEAFKNSKNSKEFKEKRKIEMDKLTKEFNSLSREELNEILDSVNRTDIDGLEGAKTGEFRHSFIYHTAIRTPKFLEIEKRIKEYKTNYDNIRDLMMIDTMKLRYGEYEIKNYEKWGE